MKDPKKMEAFMEDRLDHKTGLEGKEKELGEGMVALVQSLDGKLDMSKSSDEALGRYIQIMVKTDESQFVIPLVEIDHTDTGALSCSLM